MRPTANDVPRIAEAVTRAAELLTQSGVLGFQRVESWQTGVRSPNLDPSTRGSRYDTIDGGCRRCDGSGRIRSLDDTVLPVADGLHRLVLCPDCDGFGNGRAIIPNDPTGEAVLQTDPMRDVADRFKADLEQFHVLANRITNVLLSAVRNAARPSNDPTEELVAEGWCSSCVRDHGYLEPIAEHKGQRIYAELCRWCGDFKRVENVLPPVALLRERHSGKRITQQAVQRALGRKAS